MLDFSFRSLTEPNITANKRNMFVADDNLYVLSNGELYKYNDNLDSWIAVVTGSNIGVDTSDYYFLYNKTGRGVIYKRGLLWIVASSAFGNLALQYVDLDNREVFGPYPVYRINGQSVINIYFENGDICSCENELLTISRHANSNCFIDLNNIEFNRRYNRFEIPYQYEQPYVHSRGSYVWYNPSFSNEFVFGINSADDLQAYYQLGSSGLYYVLCQGHLYYQTLEVAVMDLLGFILIYSKSDDTKRCIIRIYIDDITGDNISYRKEVLGYIDKSFLYTAGIIYNNKFFTLGNSSSPLLPLPINEFGMIIGNQIGDILRLGHLGRIISINGYNSGLLPFKHNGRIYYLKECQNGDPNQSPLVIKHNGTLHYISK